MSAFFDFLLCLTEGYKKGVHFGSTSLRSAIYLVSGSSSVVEHRLANMNCQHYNLTEKTINKVRNILNNKIATA